MRYRSNIYVFTQTARYLLAVLLMLFPATILASSVNTIDTISIAKSLGDVVNRVISETESSIDLGTGTPNKNHQQPRSSGYVILMSVMVDMLSANNEKSRNLIYNVLNGNKHGAANVYDKELFADHRS